MSFIYCDSETGGILDIVEESRLHVLKDYFLQYTKEARYSVETIVIDMYAPYIPFGVLGNFLCIKKELRTKLKNIIKLPKVDDKILTLV